MSTRPVVGIDPSLTGTGLAYAGESEKVLTAKASTVRGQLQRMNTIASRVALHVPDGALVVMEGPALGRGAQAWHHVLGGLWWILAATVVNRGATLVEVPPKTLKKFATGNGNADKAAMCAAWFEHTGQAITDHDRADALWCRQVGLHLVGAGEALALPARQLAAAEGLRDQLPTTGSRPLALVRPRSHRGRPGANVSTRRTKGTTPCTRTTRRPAPSSGVPRPRSEARS